MNYLQNTRSDTKSSKRNSITWKLLAIVFLMLIFLIPSSLVGNLIRERAQRQQNTIQEVSASWGRPQTIAGPILVMPFDEIKDKDEPPVTEYAYFLPSVLDVNGNVAVEMRSRGIYDVPVYETTLTLSGKFPPLAVNGLGVPESRFRPAESAVVIGIPDMRGVAEEMTLVWGEKTYPFAPGAKGGGVVQAGAHVEIPVAFGGGETPFKITVKVRGSQALAFMPIGKKTTVTLSSNWPHPSFAGAFLPAEHTITDSGFTANWHVLDLNRTFPDKWTVLDGYVFSPNPAEEIAYQQESQFLYTFEPRPYPIDGKGGMPVGQQIADAFGVRLLEPVDLYQKTERSAKYAIAVIALVFVVILFTELTARRRIHPVQYALIGFALVVFYTLLLSLAEHIRFGWSYLIASAAVIGLITLFCRSVMQSASRALMAGGILTLFYGFVYVILQLTDYALLLGSIALFCIIAAIMVVSRRIDWYGIGQEE